METVKLIITLAIVLITCFSVTFITFYDEYKINKKLPDEDVNKETTFSLLYQCFITGLVSSLFIGIPALILLLIIFSNSN